MSSILFNGPVVHEPSAAMLAALGMRPLRETFRREASWLKKMLFHQPGIQ